MKEIKTIELQLAGWQKSDSHGRAPMVQFFLQSDEDVEWFERFTAAKGKGKNHIAGQIFDAAISLSDQDDQPTPVPKGGSLAKSAGIICNDPDFQEFTAGKVGAGIIGDTEADYAARYVRLYCDVDSRAELDSDPHAAKAFAQLMAVYREWLK